MNVSNTAHPEVQLIDALQLAGWDERGYVSREYSTRRTYGHKTLPVQFVITNESVSVSGPSHNDVVVLRVLELDTKGWSTGVEHEFRVTPTNASAIATTALALAAALAR